MRYIKNPELREWVKDNLRKAIFQKAHSLAVQTGCEVLIKLDDVVDTSECQYYATDVLQKAYDNNQLKKSPSDVQISGETGLPLIKTVETRVPVTELVDRGSQSSMCSDDEGHRALSVGNHGNVKDLETGGSASLNLRNVIRQSQAKSDLSDEDDNGDDFDDDSDKDETSHLPQVIKDDPTSQTDHPTETEASCKDNAVKDGTNELSGTVEESMESGDQMSNQLEGEKEKDAIPPSGNSSTPLPMPSANVVAGASTSRLSRESLSLPMSPSIRPYQCGVCQKTFGSIQVLSRHAQTFHGMNRGMRYYCNICGQSYKLAQYLQAHVKMHDMVTVAPVLCKICGMGYYSNAALKQHELTHSTTTIPSEPAHTVSSHTEEEQEESSAMQSKPNPRLQLSQSTMASSSSLKSGRLLPQSPDVEAKRFKPSAESDEKDEDTKDESYHEPKQYHCLVCGMAFEEGEQLELHVMKTHMQQDDSQAPATSSPDKATAGALPDDTDSSDDQPQDGIEREETQIKEEAITPPPSTSHHDTPGTSEASLLFSGPNATPISSEASSSLFSGRNATPGTSDASSLLFSGSNATTFPPLSALDNPMLGLPRSQALPYPPPPAGPLLNPNANITSVLEQALPSLLPGISLLSNPTQLPMAHAAASIAKSEGQPPMVSQDGRFTCDICGNSYKYNCTLKEHRLTHAQTPLFSCKICNQAFSRQRQLRDHMFRHSGAYPYHCKYCGKGFVRPSILRRHETDRHKQAWENLS